MAEEKPKKFAIQKLVRGPDGKMRLIFLDSKTGAEISDVSDYHIVSATDGGWQVTPPPKKDDKDKKPSASEETISGVGRDRERGEGSNAPGSNPNDAYAPAPYVGPENNYGYFDKPSFMGFAGALPGPLGLAGKAVNSMFNLNNVGAIDAARRDLGIENERGFFGTVKDIGKGPNPSVGEITGPLGNTLNVSMEPGPAGPNFSVSPMEAKAIMATDPNQPGLAELIGYTPGSGLGVPVTEPQTPSGFLGRMTGLEEGWGGRALGNIGRGIRDVATDFIGSMFGGNTQQNRTNYFPDPPAPPSQQPASGFAPSKGGFSGSGGGGASLSPAAQDAIDSGYGGLY